MAKLNSCHWVQDRLEDLVADRLQDGDRVQAEEHLLDCMTCLQSFSEFLEAETGEPLPSLQAPELNVCLQAQDQLGAWLDRDLDRVTDYLLHQHLVHCEHCVPVAETLVQLANDLPDLADLDPDEHFVADVLAMTSGSELAKEESWCWADRLTSLIRRPRFAMELAYVLSIVIFLGLKLGTGLDIDRKQLTAGPQKVHTGLVELRAYVDQQYRHSQVGMVQRWEQTVSVTSTGLSFVSAQIERMNGAYRSLVQPKSRNRGDYNHPTGWRHWLWLGREHSASPGEGVGHE